jgi:hypothetical protein
LNLCCLHRRHHLHRRFLLLRIKTQNCTFSSKARKAAEEEKQQLQKQQEFTVVVSVWLR